MKKAIVLFLSLVLSFFISGLIYGDIPLSERAALIDLYNYTNGDGWTSKTGWKDPPLEADGFAGYGSEDSWFGIGVTDDHVTGINLVVKNLTGTLPDSLGDLSSLEMLNLSSNDISGSIPDSLGDLSNLEDIGLQCNNLTGSIPGSLGDLSNLEDL